MAEDFGGPGFRWQRISRAKNFWAQGFRGARISSAKDFGGQEFLGPRISRAKNFEGQEFWKLRISPRISKMWPKIKLRRTTENSAKDFAKDLFCLLSAI